MAQNNMILYIVLAVAAYMILVKQNSKEFFLQGSGLGDNYKADYSMCSVDCCGSQWPVSFMKKKDSRIKDNNYVSTNMTCTGLSGRGCVCYDKKQYNFLQKRGNNA